ncbi:MAG: flippase-like domain-containing protein, partial [Candidatus Cloacimonetes bacterium]|nr:flippase-like domain-containing protein [Candidatus Cloacimonadota bacterium]
MSRSHWFSLLVSLIFLYLFLFDPSPAQLWNGTAGVGEALFRNRIHWAEVGEQIARMHLGWFSLAFSSLILAMCVRAVRWQVIVNPMKKLSFGVMFGLNNLGYMANNLLPMRLGELLRGIYLARKAGMPVSSAMATVVLERVFDMLGALGCLFALLVFVPLAILGDRGPLVHGLLPTLSWIVGTGLVLLVALVVFRERVQSRLNRMALILPARLADMVTRLLDSFIKGLAILESPWRTLWLVVLTGILYGCYYLSLKTMMLAMGLNSISLPLLAAHPLGSILLVLVFVTVG